MMYSFEIHLNYSVINYIKNALHHHKNIRNNNFNYMFKIYDYEDDELYDLCKILFELEIPFIICCIESNNDNRLLYFLYRFDGENIISYDIMPSFKLTDEEIKKIQYCKIINNI